MSELWTSPPSKKFHIALPLYALWTAAVKRNVVNDKYKDLVDKLYTEDKTEQ